LVGAAGGKVAVASPPVPPVLAAAVGVVPVEAASVGVLAAVPPVVAVASVVVAVVAVAAAVVPVVAVAAPPVDVVAVAGTAAGVGVLSAPHAVNSMLRTVSIVTAINKNRDFINDSPPIMLNYLYPYVQRAVGGPWKPTPVLRQRRR